MVQTHAECELTMMKNQLRRKAEKYDFGWATGKYSTQ
jgi:hypothetical protein